MYTVPSWCVIVLFHVLQKWYTSLGGHGEVEHAQQLQYAATESRWYLPWYYFSFEVQHITLLSLNYIQVLKSCNNVTPSNVARFGAYIQRRKYLSFSLFKISQTECRNTVWQFCKLDEKFSAWSWQRHPYTHNTENLLTPDEGPGHQCSLLCNGLSLAAPEHAGSRETTHRDAACFVEGCSVEDRVWSSLPTLSWSDIWRWNHPGTGEPNPIILLNQSDFILWGIIHWVVYCSFRVLLTLKVLNFWKLTSYWSLKPLWSGMGEVVPGSYLTDPTSPIPSHCMCINCRD